jgi:uncharacterized protein (DUF58 family)
VAFTVVIFFLTIFLSPLRIHWFVFVGGNILLVFLLLLDFFISPKPALIHVRRESEDKLYFKINNEIKFYIENGSLYYLHIEAVDEIPDRFFITVQKNLSYIVKSGMKQTFTYTVLPGKRGSFLFEHIHLRFRGLLGLCLKYAKIHCPIEYKVYPNVKDLSKYRLLTQRHRLLPQGEKTVRIFGTGDEFESLRAYVEGDDYRKMNWMATARENRLIVNRYQSEKNQPVIVLLDTGRPMSYKAGGYKKLDYAINAALILSDIVNEKGDQSGLLVFDTYVQAYISPGKGAGHKQKLMEILYHVKDSRNTSDYEGVFRAVCDRQKRRSLLFIFTDFEILEEAEELISNMAWLKRRHFPVVVFMENESLEALANQKTYGKKDEILARTARAFQEERKMIRRKLNMLGIPNIESSAEDFAISAVNKYLIMTGR